MVFKANPGGIEHVRARDRVIALLTSRGFTCQTEVEFKDCETPLGLRDYTADFVGTLKVIGEIDGKTHWSKNAIHKDSVRDAYFSHIQNALTARISQFDCVGKNTTDNDLLFAEFLYKLWGVRLA